MTAPDPIEHREARERAVVEHFHLKFCTDGRCTGCLPTTEQECREELVERLEEAHVWIDEAQDAQERANQNVCAALVAYDKARTALGDFDAAHPLSGIEQEETGT